MKVFIAWSGSRSEGYARLLAEYIPQLLPNVEVWVSGHNIAAGTRWRTELRSGLEACQMGVLCLTAHNAGSSWILYEAGALSNRFDDARVLPYLIDTTPDSLPEPLTQWQSAPADLDGTRRLVDSINKLQEHPIDESRLEAMFQRWWPDLHSQFERVTSDVDDGATSGPSLTLRENTEWDLGDPLLTEASAARFIAMTYKTLGAVLSREVGPYPTVLKSVEIFIYALPILREWHPQLSGSKNEYALSAEWRSGLVRTLKSFTDPTKHPEIVNVNVGIVSRLPRMTLSDLTTANARGEQRRHLRCTHLFDETKPSDSPTVSLQIRDGDGPFTRLHKVYEAAADQIYGDAKTLPYPVMQDGVLCHGRGGMEDFVDALSRVCNHRDYEVQDQRFSAHVQQPSERGHGDTPEDRPELTPGAIAENYASLRAHGRLDRFRVTVDLDQAAIEFADGAVGSGEFESRIRASHIVGSFALLVDPADASVCLVDKPKGQIPAWHLDVPGGKVAESDADLQQTLKRESFEELGLPIDTDRIGECVAVKYDPKSKKENVPVVAFYFPYLLSNEEVEYLRSLDAVPAHPRRPVVFYRLDQLAGEKLRSRNAPGSDPDTEVVCHAPLEAIQRTIELLA